MSTKKDSDQPDPREIEICKTIGEYLYESESGKPERLSKINTLKNLLEFEQRVAELTDAETEHYSNCVDNIQLSDEMRATLDGCETQERKDYYTNMWARAIYMTRCAWEDYFHTGRNKPLVPNPLNKIAVLKLVS